jgi:sulfur relay (sulfurtransferase) DsrF/TusC family protein
MTTDLKGIGGTFNKRKRTLIILSHGTYGHNDDAYGAMLVINAILAMGSEATLLLRDDGVYMALKGQDPNEIGQENNLKQLADLVELGGKIYLFGPSLEARAIERSELLDDITIIERMDLVKVLKEHELFINL